MGENKRCSICCKIIVGACIVNCPSSHVFCVLCLEDKSKLEEPKGWIRTKRVPGNQCPSCLKQYTKSMPCKTLDAIIQSVVDSEETSSQEKNDFYARVKSWRNEVIKRQKEINKTEDMLKKKNKE